MSLYPRPLPSTLAAIPGGTNGVRATLATMVRLTRTGRRDVGIVQLARSIALPVPARDYRGEVQACLTWVKLHIRYVADPRDVESVASPDATLKMQSGDCDDMSVLLASLLEAIGHRTRFVAFAYNTTDEPYSHVLCQTLLGAGVWVTLDPTISTSTIGWTPPGATRGMIAHV